MSTITIDHKEDRRTGVIGTVVFHALLVLLFLFFGLQQPDPPLEETGVEIAMADFGTTDMGSGNTETPDPGSEQASAAPTPDTSPEAPEEVATEEESEVSQVTPPKPTPKPKPKPDPPKEQPKPEEPKEPAPRKPNPNALFTPGGTSGGNSGEGQSQQPGNAGVEHGKPDGLGTFSGKGFDGRLDGRGLLGKPTFGNEHNESGTVAVDIRVDPSGKVVFAKGRIGKPTTTTSTQLHRLAEAYARQFSFSAKSDISNDQAGYIVFTFTLQ